MTGAVEWLGVRIVPKRSFLLSTPANSALDGHTGGQSDAGSGRRFCGAFNGKGLIRGRGSGKRRLVGGLSAG